MVCSVFVNWLYSTTLLQEDWGWRIGVEAGVRGAGVVESEGWGLDLDLFIRCMNTQRSSG